MKRKVVDKMKYAEKYYKMRQARIDAAFGNEKNWLSAVKYNIRQDSYYKTSNARLDMQDLLQDAEGKDSQLSYAKRNATNKDLFFPDARMLNRKMVPNSAKTSKAKWEDLFGNNIQVMQYYEIKNSNYVLANIITSDPDENSPIESWEYINKDLV